MVLVRKQMAIILFVLAMVNKPVVFELLSFDCSKKLR